MLSSVTSNGESDSEARDDLQNLYLFIAERSGDDCALAFHVTTDTVTFDRVFYGGRDLGSLASEDT